MKTNLGAIRESRLALIMEPFKPRLAVIMEQIKTNKGATISANGAMIMVILNNLSVYKYTK